MIRFNDILDKISSFYSEKDITLLQKAYVFAAHAHKGQVRRSGEPYLSHPLEVTNMLADMKLDTTTLCAGLLHDILEDTDSSSSELMKAFGKEITQLVEGVTKISLVQDSSPEKKQAEIIRKIILAMTDDLRVIFIKLADRIHNLKTLKFLPEEKQKTIAKETLEIYAPIANRLGMGRIKAELEDFSFRYVLPENYFRIVSLIEPIYKKTERELKKIRKILKDLMSKNHIPAKISYRIKRPYSIYNKMEKRGVNFEQVYDFMALRIITDTPANCYSILGIIHQNWPHIPQRFRDLISMPKTNLYQSLHSTILTGKKQTIEIQIRTKEMHELAEKGISAHWKYKEPDPSNIVKEDARLHWLREMAELFKGQKNPKEFLKNLKVNLIPEEVTVFTPKGQVITLPLGSSVLDFAFKIHTEIGLHCKHTKINGKNVPLKTILKSGDIVEIVTSSETVPSRNWLNMAFTSKARHHIKRWLNLQEKKKNIVLGKRLWGMKIKQHSLPPEWLEKENFLDHLKQATNLKPKNMNEFYAMIGFGKIVLDKKVMNKISPPAKEEKKKRTKLKKVVKKVTKKRSLPLQVKDMKSSLVKLAKCCSPIKGEPIIGYITSGKGVTVHSLRCPLVSKEILDSKRMIDVAWDQSLEGSYKGKLIIVGKDIPGILANLTAVIAQLGGNITKADVATFSDNKTRIRVSMTIQDYRHLKNIIKKISGIKDIYKVKRI